MADNIAITAGAGTTIATDDVGGVHYQFVKLVSGTLDATDKIGGDATNGLDVDVTRVSGNVTVVNGGTFATQLDGTGLTRLTDIETNTDSGAVVGNGAAATAQRVTLANDSTGIVALTTSTASIGKLAANSGVDIGDVDVLSIAAGTNYIGKVRLTDGTNDATLTSAGALFVGGSVAHDAADAGNPLKIGAKAINHGTNPTSVTANDRTDIYASRAGIPWVIGGHPNVVTLKHTTITTAVTNASIIAGAANVRIVVTRITATLDNASTVFPTLLMGFHATTTPTTTGVLASHGGIPAGGGFSIGDGSGILGIGAAADALLVTTTGNATGNGLQICVSYYTINEA